MDIHAGVHTREVFIDQQSRWYGRFLVFRRKCRYIGKIMKVCNILRLVICCTHFPWCIRNICMTMDIVCRSPHQENAYRRTRDTRAQQPTIKPVFQKHPHRMPRVANQRRRNTHARMFEWPNVVYICTNLCATFCMEISPGVLYTPRKHHFEVSSDSDDERRTGNQFEAKETDSNDSPNIKVSSMFEYKITHATHEYTMDKYTLPLKTHTQVQLEWLC